MHAASGRSSRDEPRRIHLYRPQNQLGDLLLNVPAIRAIRDRYPRAHVTLVVGRQNADAVLGQPWADEIRVVDARSVLGVVRASLRTSARPDLAVYFTTVSYSKGAAYLARRFRARERIGFQPSHHGKGDRAILTHAVPYPEGVLHQSQVSLILAAAAGAGPPPPPPYYLPDPALVARAPSGVAYLHPGAGKLQNRWPAARFAQVARALADRGAEPVLLEGPQDGGTAGEVSLALGRHLPVVRGETIPVLAARFARAAVYIGNDTGPLHLAGAVGCPTVGVYGWSDPREWSPVGARTKWVRAADHSLESVTAEQVLDVALPMLTEERCLAT